MNAIDKMFPSRKCSLCGKEFIPAPEHAYRDRTGKNWRIFCSWHCYNHRDDNKVNKRVRAVERCTISGEVVETYESARLASERNDMDAHYIREACRTGNIYRGYLWRYKNDLP